ncbi:TonB-dependent receptor [Cystobacter ferrugineus]|uniref:TonB-dependent receptor n=1 Tax=Cystobacter ferrugineus TaxID=83449 RepID=A0A1L9B6G9_9BACT|nr:TonB-dependent receptor [Cystobacter ferrugineus]
MATLLLAWPALAASQPAEPLPPQQPSSTPAQEPPPEGSEDTALSLGEVVQVQGRGVGPLSSAEVLTSVNILGREQLEQENANEPLELLRRAPAVYVDTYNQGIVGSELGIRGFSTQGETAHTRLLIDGIPSNLHIGVSELKSVFPMEIERMEVVKGTNDPRYGLNNVAGNVNVHTRRSGNERKVRLLGGSFVTLEPQVMAGFDDGRLAQTYFAAYRHANGYRANSDTNRLAASGKWFLELDERWRVGLVLRGMNLAAQAPGYLTLDESRLDPTASVDYATSDGGTQRNLHASLHVDHDFSSSLSWSLKAYGQGFRRTRWVRQSSESSQQERIENEKQYGAISVLTLRTDELGLQGFSAEWGVDYQFQDNLHQRYRTRERERTGGPVRHHDFGFHSFGTYVQARAWPLDMLKLVAGLRVDGLAGRLRDRLSGQEYGINDSGPIWQPKLSAVFTPLYGHNLYANYGRTFQTGVGIGAYQTQAERLAPSLNDGWEVGYKSNPLSWLTGRVSYWQQHASNEVQLKFDNSGDSENLGQTLRRGFDVELTLQPLEPLLVWGAFSRHVSEQVEPGPAFPERKGKELNHVPDFSAKAGVDYRPLPALRTSLWMYAQGDYYLDKENTLGQYGDYLTLNLDLSYELTSWLQVAVQVKNLLDARYSSSVWYRDFEADAVLYNPADGRSFYVSTTATF